MSSTQKRQVVLKGLRAQQHKLNRGQKGAGIGNSQGAFTGTYNFGPGVGTFNFGTGKWQ
jgi:hypothetical protein